MPRRYRLSLPLWCPAGGLNPRGTGYPCRCGESRGGLPSLSPAYPAFSFLFCPLSPRPPSPVGKGETKSLFRRGLRPRHPCIRPFAALTETAKQVPSGGLAPPALPVRRALAAPCGGLNPRGTGYPCRCGARRGGLPSLSPAYPAFSLFSFPLSPRPPSPVGKGEIFCFLMQGAPPLASPRLNPRGTYTPAKQVPAGGLSLGVGDTRRGRCG